MASKIGQRIGVVPINIQLLNRSRCGQFGESGCQEVRCNAEALVELVEARWTGV
jgi:hypothetical protein